MTKRKEFSESAARVIAEHGDGLQITIVDDRKVDAPGGVVNTDPRQFTVACGPALPFTTKTAEGARVETGDTLVVVDRLNPLITFEPAAEMKAELSDGRQFTIVENDIRTGSYRLRLKGGSPA